MCNGYVGCGTVFKLTVSDALRAIYSLLAGMMEQIPPPAWSATQRATSTAPHSLAAFRYAPDWAAALSSWCLKVERKPS